MPSLSYARKKRQLRQLSEKLQIALFEKEGSPDYIHKLIVKIKCLINELKLAVSARELKRILGTVAVFFGLSLTHNLSAQNFAPAVQNPFGMSDTTTYIFPAFADLDGDGDMDMLVGSAYGMMHYFENTGTATNPQFAAPVNSPFGIATDSAYFLAPAFADLDGDGDQDLVMGVPYPGGLLYYKNNGTSTNPQFGAPVLNPFGISTPLALAFPAFADLDNDGDLDLLIGDYGGSLNYSENTGSATNPQFATPTSNPFGLSNSYYFATPSFADVDGDGDQDLLVGEYYGNLQYFKNIGSKTAPQFAALQQNPFGLSAVNYNSSPAFADLDGDGDMDLIVGEYYGNLIYFKNTSPGVGLNEIPAFAFEVYPTPATDYLKITTDEEIAIVEVLDMSGRLIMKHQGSANVISVEKLAAGSYFIKIINDKGEVVMQKLQKQ